MDLDYLKKIWTEEEQKVFQGWDFSHLKGRWQYQALPWDYEKIISEYLKSTDRLLDMGTGGGEFLLSLNHPYNLTCATEAYPPNVELCMKKLKPLGIDIRQVNDDVDVPFEDNGFEILMEEEVFTKLKFFDIGALVYFAKIIEWEFPGFSVEGCFDMLCKLHFEIEEKGFVEGTEHRFLIVARKN